MRPEGEYRQALDLIRAGINDCEVGRRLGIPRGTIKSWRDGFESGSGGRTDAWTGSQVVTCFRCNEGPVDEVAYTYLLGMYLGDGWIRAAHRGVYQLRITCDRKYPEIIDQVANHIIVVRGSEAVGLAGRTGCIDVNSYWKHWPCVFPQHGPGRKHERKVELADWQRIIVGRHPEWLIRGLIHSDGNRHINPITKRLPSGTKEYRYSRYMFTNASTEIQDIFTGALDALGVHWTQTMPRIIAISRRDDVAYLDTFVGPKS